MKFTLASFVSVVARSRRAAFVLTVVSAWSASPALSAGFDEQAWRVLAAHDPLEAIERVRFRLQQKLPVAERVRSHALLGALLADELGDLAGGIDNYRAAILAAPTDAQVEEIRYALALALISAGDYPAARKELQLILARRPDHPLAFSMRATLADLEGKPKEAKRLPPPRLPRAALLPRMSPPTTPEKAPPTAAKGTTIRVLVAREYALDVTSGGTLFVYDGRGSELAKVSERVSCRAVKRQVSCGRVAAEVLQVIPAKSRFVSVLGNAYRGSLVLRVESGKVAAINRLGIEQYLYGVLPREVPHEWPPETLKAQAIAARTYAYSQMQRANELPYDVESTVLSQVYGGRDAEKAATNRAVDATRDLVMRYGGKIIVAYFHSHSGGRTEDPRHVWGARLPYLQSQDDPFSLRASELTWSAEYDVRELQQKLVGAFPFVGDFKGLSVLRRNGARVEKVRLEGTKRSVELSANRLRLLLAPARLKSTAFSLEKRAGGLRFRGRGYGHGVGLSQWGAMAMAEAGHHYDKILSFYYRGVSIEPIAAAK